VSDAFLPALRAHLGDRYRLHGEVARGGMARVYRADDLIRGGEVAIKVLRPELAAALGPDRFLREIQILGRLRHPNILPLLDSREGAGSLYYVTPYISGPSLQRRLERGGPLPTEEVLRISRDVAAALDHAHRENVIHRDIKPANILLDRERAVVCDFGVARAIVRAATESFSSGGLVVGTAAYMSPEQAMGATEIGPQSDLYSFACVVYEMLAGERPFTGATAQAILARQLAEQPRSLRAVRPEVPARIEQAVLMSLAKAPDARPRGVRDFLARLGGEGA
jgi:eukaryotic-like serine/threonine-protein kinase